MRRREGVCKPVHFVAEEVADGIKSLPEKVLALPLVGVMGVVVFRLDADAPHLVTRAGVS